MRMMILLFWFLFSFTACGKEQATVVVLDSGLDLHDPRFTATLCKTGHYDATNTGIQDTVGHGTHVAGLIKQYAGNANYCLIIVKYYAGSSTKTMDWYLDALSYIRELAPKIVNISGGGSHTTFVEAEVIAALFSTLFIVAAGNSNKPVSEFYPAALSLYYPNIMAVGALDGGNKAQMSNYGPNLVWEPGVNIVSTLPNGAYGAKSGTSMACAIHTGKMLREKY